jgi:LmbE family N-acetylglucosaminyl deacetylase
MVGGRMEATVIVSPHQDDAVFSLWHVLAGDGDVSVVNVFAGVPGPGRVGWWDAETGAADAGERSRERRREDHAALAFAGRSSIDLDFVDAQYREGAQDAEPIAAAIAAAVPGDALLLAPAGLGAHPDHQLARSAALALRARDRRVGLYADVPHATRHGWPSWVINGTRGDRDEASERWRADLADANLGLSELDARVHELDAVATERKLAALAEYRTQLPALTTEFSLTTRPEALRFEVVWAP